MSEELRIFAIDNDIDTRHWVCAKTNIQAIEVYLKETQKQISDISESVVFEFPRYQYPAMFINLKASLSRISFDEWMRIYGYIDYLGSTKYIKR